MHISDALIDAVTGNPIVSGRIALGLGKRFILPAHDHILLDFSRRGLACKAVTEMTELETGFFRTRTAEPQLRFSSLTLAQFGRDAAGSEWQTHIDHGWAEEKSKLLFSVTRSILSQRLCAGGMEFSLDGEFGAAQYSDRKGEEPEPDSRFTVQGDIPWATLILKNIAPCFRDHQFVPRSPLKTDTPVDFRGLNPFAIRDLRIQRGLAWPMAGGNLILDGPGERSQTAAQRIVIVHFDKERLSFSDSDRACLQQDGFCHGMGSKLWLAVELLNGPMIESLLDRRDKASLSLQGDGIGSVRYNTQYGSEPGDRLGKISQRMRSLDFEAELSKNGLTLSLSGALGPFDPREIEEHRRERGSTLVPWERFSLATTMPWTLLLVRDSTLAKRSEHFASSV